MSKESERLLSNSGVHPRGGGGGPAALSKPNLMNEHRFCRHNIRSFM